MPSYTVYSAADCLDGTQRAALARSITVVHSEHTGAPRSFVQTIFLPVAPGAHFIGAEPAHPRSLWVYGHIRSGRPEQVRTAIAEAITTAAAEVAGIPRRYIWVYLNELTRTDMVEFGTVLPLPGEEAAWIDRMPPETRDHVRSLG